MWVIFDVLGPLLFIDFPAEVLHDSDGAVVGRHLDDWGEVAIVPLPLQRRPDPDDDADAALSGESISCLSIGSLMVVDLVQFILVLDGS